MIADNFETGVYILASQKILPPPLKFFPVLWIFLRSFKLHKGILTCVFSLFSFFFSPPHFPSFFMKSSFIFFPVFQFGQKFPLPRGGGNGQNISLLFNMVFGALTNLPGHQISISFVFFLSFFSRPTSSTTTIENINYLSKNYLKDYRCALDETGDPEERSKDELTFIDGKVLE